MNAPLVQNFLGLARQSSCRDDRACEQKLTEAAEQQRSLIGTLLDDELVDETAFLKAIADWLGMQWWTDPVLSVAVLLREKLPPKIALRFHLLPVKLDESGLLILTCDPFNLYARQAVAYAVPEKVRWAMATRRLIVNALRQGYGVGAETFEQILEGRDGEAALDRNEDETTVLDSEDSEASVIKFVNQIIREALRERATDIHVEPLGEDLRIRYRIDGVLHETPVPGQIKVLRDSVISRLKIMSHLDIAERRLPQDGRISLELEGQPIDVRVATIPSVTGESVSLRLLGQQRFDIAGLNLDAEAQQTVRNLLAMPNGIILVTGPTGCGKSTTLYSFLTTMNTKERRIVTIEDPVEHKLPGVVQIAVKPEIDLTFARGLRSILRGDPNVIMVGEMRDFETAEIAIRAALTGHLVFSTLHTNDAIGGITRLIDMGVEPFLVGSSVRAFIAQRLVRVLCPNCKTPANFPIEDLQEVGFPVEHADKVLKAVGCEACRQTGYQGRCAIFEIVTVSSQLQDFITQKKAANMLKIVAIGEGMKTLREYGFGKVIEGVTTVEEVVRVTAADNVDVLDE